MFGYYYHSCIFEELPLRTLTLQQMSDDQNQNNESLDASENTESTPQSSEDSVTDEFPTAKNLVEETVTDDSVENSFALESNESEESLEPQEAIDNSSANVDTETDENAVEESQTAMSQEDSKTETESDLPNTGETEVSYHFERMTMAELVSAFESILSIDSLRNMRDRVDDIKKAFDSKFNEAKAEAELAHDNETEDPLSTFYFQSDEKKAFDKLFKTYQQKRKASRRELEEKLQQNLKIRLQIIDEIKALFESPEEMAEIYKVFKGLQKQWRNTGAVPRLESNNLWQTYHHHVENFYTFLHLNREFRDLDFKHNLEQKLKIIEVAEELAKKPFTNKVFRELQTLHKMWKEELGPVHREQNEEIWKRFQDATKIIHDKRQNYNASLDENYLKNLVQKQEIIAEITELAIKPHNTHREFQQASSAVQKLRERFLEVGKVPTKDRNVVWDAFKEATRVFNRNKNRYFKNQKNSQLDNLNKKKELIAVAEEHMNSSDFQTSTPIMKRIQLEWKAIGQVPRNDSDKIWKQFKSACNTYFENLKKERSGDTQEAIDAVNHKTEYLKTLKEREIPADQNDALQLIKTLTSEWNTFGHVPRGSKDLETKFKKYIDGVLKGLGVSKEALKSHLYESKLRDMYASDDSRSFDYEQIQLRKKIDEISGEIRQLENNLQFFSNVDSSNPMLRDVHKNIEKKRSELEEFQAKMNTIKRLIREED